MSKPVGIKTANDLRLAIMQTIEGVIDGKVSVTHAKAVAELSEQVHKSLQQEWDMRVYAHEHFSLDKAGAIVLLGSDQ
jgi:hypothetical protein